MEHYQVGVDIGGTFTDCVVLSSSGELLAAKSPSTPPHFATGMLNAMRLVAERLELDFETFCSRISLLTHGTTVGTNTLIQRRGAKVGLITTKGHEDIIHIMRGSRGIDSRNLNPLVHFPESQKPVPIVPKRYIRGVSERVDCHGEVVVNLNEAEVIRAVDELLALGVEAIAVGLLWSFKHPAHEQRIAQIIRERAPGMFVSTSVELAPKWGEYERMTATVLNAYIGPVTSNYLKQLDGQLRAAGYRRPLQITSCGGGSISVERAIQAPLLTLDSGPVSGVTASLFMGKLIKCDNIITTDMGGTSFDVGIIHRGKPAYSSIANVAQYEYFIPKVDIQAIGSGGGSLARVDPITQALRVGPESAGADPGPACYGKGNTTPTVTDADVVLGYIDPDNFLGGRIRLDRARSEEAIAGVAKKIGLGMFETAAGIAKIAEFKMADIIRKTTVEKGFDPRDFTVFAFGGAGPVHAGVFSRELGVQRVLIPLNRIASTWCAFGAATADLLHVHEQVDIQSSPFRLDRVNRVLADLAKHARDQMKKDGVPASRLRLSFSIDMRHRGQINEVEVDLPALTEGTRPKLSAQALNDLHGAFYERYEAIYGKGSSYADARLEMVTFRVRARSATQSLALKKQAKSRQPNAESARTGYRKVFWSDLGEQKRTPIYDGAQLRHGMELKGPAVIETTDTNIVLQPKQRLRVDALGNFEILFGG
ncbi:MAG: hydantoinase/oxoprolinase family protein [Burkholderiaceae bacterium]|jgi:N-methylhydantoinase A